MPKVVLDEDDGLMEVEVKRKLDDGSQGTSFVKLDAFHLGAVFYDLYQQWDGKEESWLNSVQGVFASWGLPNLTTKNALTLQRKISDEYNGAAKKSDATTGTESAPVSPTPTASMPSTSGSATATS